MAVLKSVWDLAEVGTGMKSRDDLSLLRAIAEHRDQAAFTELFERYRDDIFNFASRILLDSALAQDAIQETMLSIWLSTKPIPQNVNARGWILSIVTTKSLNLRCSRRRRSKREERRAMEVDSAQAAVVEEVEGNELIAVLRRQIDQLPDLERTVLACSYCTSMSQQEIAKVVGVSQRTVSNKIQQALERLRMDLTKAGVASVVPLLSRGNVFEAMTTGDECPPGMMEGITLRIESYEKAARAMSRRTIATNTGRSAWIIGAVVVMAVAAVLGVRWFSQPNQIATIPQPSAKAPAPALQTAVPAKALFKRTWSFQDGPPQDLIPEVGSWSWKKQSDGKGAMAVAFPTSLVALPVQMPRKPLMIEIVVYAPTERRWPTASIEAYWREKDGLVPYKFYQSGGSVLWQGVSTIQIYTDSNHIALLTKTQEPFRVVEYEKPYPSESLCLAFEYISIRSISISELAPDEIPLVVRDLDIQLKLARDGSNKKIEFHDSVQIPIGTQYIPGKQFICHGFTHTFIGARPKDAQPQGPTDEHRK